ncbi:MAG: uracil-DNA glycosylase [Bdellovibrionota bacterium]
MLYSWSKLIEEESTKPYFRELQSFLKSERKKYDIFPPEKEVFTAFDLTPFENVKVVILGQDPYHGDGQAHGLSFSVKKGIKTPPSLVNIYKELHSDLGINIPEHGNLEKWAKQGVLLLNTVMTVRKAEAGSHQGQGWEIFTDRVIEVLSTQKSDIVFILWGGPSQKKASKVNLEHHHLIISPHPSPLSSYRGFFGSKPFSQANAFLTKSGKAPIDWSI